MDRLFLKPASYRIAQSILVIVVVTMSGVAGLGADTEGEWSPELPDRSLFRQGRFVYQNNCMVCHGRFGEGDGELVENWSVQPRDFSKGLFKYRSTPYNRLPLDTDLKRTIRRGIAGTPMPIFAHLPESELEAVVEYLKFLSPRWRDPGNYARPVKLPPVPDWFEDEEAKSMRAENGRELFQTACAVCHGENGDGTGTAADSLVDHEGQPNPPADLRRSLKSGPSPADAYRTISTGISGTPMMGFADTLSAEQRWQLAAFLESIELPQTNLIEATVIDP